MRVRVCVCDGDGGDRNTVKSAAARLAYDTRNHHLPVHDETSSFLIVAFISVCVCVCYDRFSFFFCLLLSYRARARPYIKIKVY